VRRLIPSTLLDVLSVDASYMSTVFTYPTLCTVLEKRPRAFIIRERVRRVGRNAYLSVEKEQRMQEEHLREIARREAPSCHCPLCEGTLKALVGEQIYSCNRDPRHWLLTKEIATLSTGECVKLLRQRSLIWTCPYCQAQIVAVSNAGKCPSCGRYVEPHWYGKTEEWRGRSEKEGL